MRNAWTGTEIGLLHTEVSSRNERVQIQIGLRLCLFGKPVGKLSLSNHSDGEFDYGKRQYTVMLQFLYSLYTGALYHSQTSPLRPLVA